MCSAVSIGSGCHRRRHTLSTVACWLACNPDSFVVKTSEFHGISADHFRYVASIRTSNRRFRVDNSAALVVEPVFFL